MMERLKSALFNTWQEQISTTSPIWNKKDRAFRFRVAAKFYNLQRLKSIEK